MTCRDYRIHEAAGCEHRPRYRWRDEDGCVGMACVEHLPARTNTLVELTLIDSDGLPLDRAAWTVTEALANALIGNRRV